MNITLEELLSDLKNNYYLDSIKIDLASEPTNETELTKIEQLAKKYNINLIFKIGGCDAIYDLHLAKMHNANGILTPMIETPYSLVKIIDNLNQIYSNLGTIELYINIESFVGVENLNSILNMPEAKYIKRIILGRDDLTKSYEFNLDLINSQKILNIAQEVSEKTFFHNKKFTIGGKILPEAETFLKKINSKKLDYIETRKLIFKKDIITSSLYKKGILKALHFEYLLLKNTSIESPILLKRAELLKNLLSIQL